MKNQIFRHNMKKNEKGFSLIEMMAAILLLSILFLGYIKNEANSIGAQHLNNVESTITQNIIDWNKSLFERTEAENKIVKNDLFHVINTFKKNDCNSNTSNVLKEEFKMFFCHVISKHQNSKVNIGECNEEICLNITLNNELDDDGLNCNNYKNCFNQKLKGLIIENNDIVRKELVI